MSFLRHVPAGNNVFFVVFSLFHQLEVDTKIPSIALTFEPRQIPLFCFDVDITLFQRCSPTKNNIAASSGNEL